MCIVALRFQIQILRALDEYGKVLSYMIALTLHMLPSLATRFSLKNAGLGVGSQIRNAAGCVSIC